MCPHCGEALIVLELQGIEIDHCIVCKGTWLDDGELDLIFQLHTEQSEMPILLPDQDAGFKTKRRCPRCHVKLRQQKLPSQIEIDNCPYGHGLWFDQGELLELLQKHTSIEEKVLVEFFQDFYTSELQQKQ